MTESPIDIRLSFLEREVQSLRETRHELNNEYHKMFGEFDGHLDLCAERYHAIERQLQGIRSFLRVSIFSGAGLAVSIIGYFVVRYGVMP